MSLGERRKTRSDFHFECGNETPEALRIPPAIPLVQKERNRTMAVKAGTDSAAVKKAAAKQAMKAVRSAAAVKSEKKRLMEEIRGTDEKGNPLGMDRDVTYSTPEGALEHDAEDREGAAEDLLWPDLLVKEERPEHHRPHKRHGLVGVGHRQGQAL